METPTKRQRQSDARARADAFVVPSRAQCETNKKYYNENKTFCNFDARVCLQRVCAICFGQLVLRMLVCNVFAIRQFFLCERY